MVVVVECFLIIVIDWFIFMLFLVFILYLVVLLGVGFGFFEFCYVSAFLEVILVKYKVFEVLEDVDFIV